MELIDGQLIVGTSEGSRRIAWYLLQDYGPDIALSMASEDLWWEALIQAFNPRPLPRTRSEWTEWAADVPVPPEPAPAGPCVSSEHRRIYSLLQHGLYHFAGVSSRGCFLGKDFVIRLGENGFTPDLIFIDRDRLKNLHYYYLDGPPALAVEITLGSSADVDRKIKRSYYEQGGVPEYWIIESDSFECVFLRLGSDGRYYEAYPDSHGIYHSSAVKDMALSVPHLQKMRDTNWKEPHLPFLPCDYRDSEPLPKLEYGSDALGWNSIPFTPRTALEPVRIRFEEFISWCPEAKFESYGLGMVICSYEATQQVMGMLMMTFGLKEIVRLAHPREWVTFLNKENYQAVVRKQTDELLRHAQYEEWEDFFSGKIPGMPEISVCRRTLEECRQEMTETVSTRVLLKIAREY
ncbi:Uma2 family endonuclease [Desulfobacterales bacterium HSG2]|nr:Uma2 family endonuclease [Desulfobacterales bacterium HSG2]